jgi:glutamate/tyrosine decarboxylase-like PLP-dependent enzyme
VAKNPSESRFIDPYFLGPYAENDGLFEKLLLQFVRDHVYWRRNFHPEDKPPIPTSAQYQPHYLDFVARLDQELHRLSATLKQAVPLFHPRYLGHMASDVLLPGLLAQIITSLYNPNNVSEDVAPTTVENEIRAARQLAQMFGMSASEESGAWGYLTSGGTLANFASLRNFTALKFYPLAMAEAARRTGLSFPPAGPQSRPIYEYAPWELVNFPIEAVIDLRRSYFEHVRSSGSADQLKGFADAVHSERIETLGLASFLAKHNDISRVRVLMTASAHYSWAKGMKLTGLGTANLIEIAIDDHMRMDIDHLAEVLDSCQRRKEPILQVVGALGTTEFGTVDPIDRILEQRSRFQNEGLYFPVHVDAAWGGYLTSMFRDPDGSLVPREELRREFRYFPSDAVYRAFSCAGRADSITVDPHKLGYIPYPAGAYICRHREIIEFVAQDAPYVFDVAKQATQRELLYGLGQYILEGSKPGSTAAAVYVTHQVLPLNREGFGRLLGQTVHASEYFYDRVCAMRKRLEFIARLSIPFPTDSNVICLCANPAANRNLAVANRFVRQLFSTLKVTPDQPIQTKEYFVSYTSLDRRRTGERQSHRVLEELGIDPTTFCDTVEDPNGEADHVFLLRHTLMNPWLLFPDDDGTNTVDRYLTFLEELIRNLCPRDGEE